MALVRASDTPAFTWDGSRERLMRLGEANRKAWLEWLRSLTPEESTRVFEDLSEGIPELDKDRPASPPPVSLFRLWKS